MDRERTDPNRLKDVHQQDLTEGRLNLDLLDWLKTKGPTYLLIILVVVTAYLSIVRWRQHKVAKNEEAWAALTDASLPRSKEDVAQEYPDIFAVPQLALNTAAAQLMQSIQSGKPVDQTAPDPAAPSAAEQTKLTAEERDHNLTRADDIYRRVLEGNDAVDGDNGSRAWTLHALHALFGRAAVAESRGDVDAARSWYEKAAQRAEGDYPALAAQARQRAADVASYATAIVLPEKPKTPTTPTTPTTLSPSTTPSPFTLGQSSVSIAPAPGATAAGDPAAKTATIDPVLRDLLLPPDAEP